MRLWREARFEVKMVKTLQFGALLEVEMFKKCMALWCGAHFEVNMFEGSLDVKLLTIWTGGQAEARRGREGTESEDRRWLRRVKSRIAKAARAAHRCGAKHAGKRQEHHMLGSRLEVEMWKKCTRLWHKAQFEVRMPKPHHARTTFGS